jgi:hypothetical protein
LYLATVIDLLQHDRGPGDGWPRARPLVTGALATSRDRGHLARDAILTEAPNTPPGKWEPGAPAGRAPGDNAQHRSVLQPLAVPHQQ